MLVGRESELATIGQFLARTPEGGALVLRADAGVGKSVLLQAAGATAAADGRSVLSAAGYQSETDLPFVGLLMLLRPLLADDRLPVAARETVAGLARGGRSGPELSPFTVALAGLDLLVSRSEQGPVLVVVDDAQWLDRASWDALVFIGRRIAFDAVHILFALRDGEEAADRLSRTGLAELRVEPLGDAEAAAVLDAHAPALPVGLRSLVLQQAAGNPLGLIELANVAGRLGESDFAPALASMELPLSRRLETAFSAAAAELPRQTRAVLLIAALDDDGELGRTIAAASRLRAAPVTTDDVEPAVDARLLEVDAASRIRFRHPLMRSAIRQSAGVAERNRAHLALAEVLTAADPADDRSIWHRAAGTIGADEPTAVDLAALGYRARSRGAVSTAVRALERAAALSEDPVQRAVRLVYAAEAAIIRGDRAAFDRVTRLIEDDRLPAGDRLQLDWFRETFGHGAWTGARRLVTFVEIIERMVDEGETDRALEALVSIVLRLWWSDPDPSTSKRYLSVAEQLDVPATDHRLIFVLAMVAPVERGALVLESLTAPSVVAESDPEALHMLGLAAAAVGALEVSKAFFVGCVRALRDQGQVGLLALALNGQAWTAARLGDTQVAGTAAVEASGLLAESEQHLWVVVVELAEGAAAAWRGDRQRAATLAARSETRLLEIGAHRMLAMVQFVKGLEAMAAGHFAEAFGQLHRVFDPADPAYHPFVRFWVFGQLVEAAGASGREEDLLVVRELLTEFAPLADRTRSPVLLTGVSYARTLLADSDEAEQRFEDALADADFSPFERARLQLAYGSWLRRRRRSAQARTHLRQSENSLTAMGLVPWAERARRELRASGETLRHGDDQISRLTPQELQIALLAVEGLSNRAIAEQLFLSPRTVSTHLYRIFPKLGITARSGLARVLSADGPAAIPGETGRTPF